MTTMVKFSLNLRWTIKRDLPEIVELERQAFGRRAWTGEDYDRALKHLSTIGLVAEDRDGIIRAVALYDLNGKEREVEILRLIVHPLCRRLGIGTNMLRKIEKKIGRGRTDRITMNVRERNLGAQLFLRSCGWRATGMKGGVIRFFVDEYELGGRVLERILDGDDRVMV